jgi:PhzF family phenazine biosynthesis protein
MPGRRFQQVDVFTEVATRGNPVAVVLDADGIDEGEMRAFAAWTNLSETTFLLPPTDPAADYRVRILTPNSELPFAGHPTLGSAHAWLAAGGQPQGDRIVQECGVGLVPLRRDGDRLSFAAPPLERGAAPAEPLAGVLAALGLTDAQVVRSQLLVNGPEWLAIEVADVDTVLGLDPDHVALAELPLTGVLARYPAGSECAIEVRGLAASVGIREDPVTGSLQASLAQWLIGEGVLPERYVAAQGTCMGRIGRAHLEAVDGQVWVGGGTHTPIAGTVEL